MFKTMKGELYSKIIDDAINALDQRYYIKIKKYWFVMQRMCSHGLIKGGTAEKCL